MKYLVDLGVSHEIVDSLNEAICYDLKVNENKITEIINFLKSIAINNLDDLISQELRILYMDLDDIKKAFDIPNRSEMIELINNDIVAIEEIL
ncbi:MAG: hypothetical protein IJO33_01945 [Bacilli bacterium]|nr:hypothetical protein [Bacilli bacterium]